MCDETESPSPGGLWDSGWNMVVRCTQHVESKDHPTPTSKQIQTVPLKQVKVPNRMSSRQKKIPLTKSDFLWQAQPLGQEATLKRKIMLKTGDLQTSIN